MNRMANIIIPVVSSILLVFVLVAGRLGYPFIGKVLVYVGGFVILINFFYTSSWVVRKNICIFKLWIQGDKWDQAVYKVMNDTEIGLKKSD